VASKVIQNLKIKLPCSGAIDQFTNIGYKKCYKQGVSGRQWIVMVHGAQLYTYFSLKS